jgi:hypothetical protein
MFREQIYKDYLRKKKIIAVKLTPTAIINYTQSMKARQS